jgi:hypothetical protein
MISVGSSQGQNVSLQGCESILKLMGQVHGAGEWKTLKIRQSERKNM